MKKRKEVIEFLKGKKYSLFDLITIQGYLQAKGIDVNLEIREGELFLAKDFIEWFEKELSWGMPIAELRHLTGRIGELYVAMMTLGQLADSVNQRGYDVVSSTGWLCCTKIS